MPIYACSRITTKRRVGCKVSVAFVRASNPYTMTRKPPASVTRTLRQEVGFGCPIDGCGNPYLEWHHFDPPWSEEEHHRPEGMIALCVSHYKKADGGAYTREQFRALKSNCAQAESIRGEFEWLRNELLAFVGGNFYHETMRIVTIDSNDIVWFNRNENGYLRLNVRMLSLLPRERAIIEDNIWTNVGAPIDLKYPPHGKELTIEYENGDYLQVRFSVLNTPEEAYEKYHCEALRASGSINYPMTTVEVNCRIGGTSVDLRPTSTSIGANVFSGNFVSHCGGGFSINVGGRWLQNPSLLPFIPTSRLTRCPCGSGLRFKHCHGLLI